MKDPFDEEKFISELLKETYRERDRYYQLSPKNEKHSVLENYL